MDNHKILSGYELVSKGATKIEATIPEIGLKDVVPNGSWLEQKQIQAALEARKHLIEVERIEKSGSLSHAIWLEEMKLAQVTQQTGGYWQYLGHSRGKHLYLKPEEALFLIETNCLHLTHNDVKVSLQQAYTLLLREKKSLLQYKVYASLSRLGYRVFRHQVKDKNPGFNNEEVQNEDIKPVLEEVENSVALDRDKTEESVNPKCASEMDVDIAESNLNKNKESTENNCMGGFIDITKSINESKQKNTCGIKKLQKLKNRKLKPCNLEILHDSFKSLPELLNKTIVTVKAPDKKYLPKTVNLRKSVYYVDIQKSQSKITTPANETHSFSPNEEVNGSHIRRLRNESYRFSNWTPPAQNFWFHNQNFQRPFNFWRPRYNFNYFHLNMLFQRPFLPGFFIPQFQSMPRPNYFRHPFLNSHNRQSRKRTRETAQLQHLEGIKRLAARLKQIFLNGNSDQGNVQALRRLIHTYNMRYKTTMRLSDTFDLINEQIVIDTITLDDDEPKTKRPRNSSIFQDNLNSLKSFVIKLKDLEDSGTSSARHRRAFSKLLKTFNQSYNEEYYVNSNYEIVNKRLITIDTSDSDQSFSDCVIEEPIITIGKKVKNPFNILKRLSEKQKEPGEPSTSRDENLIVQSEYSDTILETFTTNWLPDVDDFGRAEVIDTDNDRTIDIRQEEFLYDFIKFQPCKSNNWLNLKKSYYNSIKEAAVEFQGSMGVRINSIVKPKDCSDMTSVLKKLSIIKTEKRVKDECDLSIDFDVYNRDVQNFKKSDPPTPHFRIICLSETSNMPSGEDIAALHSKYKDNVSILFAVVGDSFSYVQVNPTDLPVYISKNN